MKFRFYITDLLNGMISGTDNKETAETYAASEDNFVVDTENGEWIQADMERVAIQAALDFTE